MRLRIASILVAAVAAGLFWSLGSHVHAVITHFVAPPLFAVVVAFWFRSASFRRQLLLLTIVLVVGEFVRLIAYSIVAGGWFYITTDGETQLAMLVSFALQWIIAILVWAVVGFLIRRYERRVT